MILSKQIDSSFLCINLSIWVSLNYFKIFGAIENLENIITTWEMLINYPNDMRFISGYYEL